MGLGILIPTTAVVLIIKSWVLDDLTHSEIFMFYLFRFYISLVPLFVCIFVFVLYSQVTFVRFLSHMLHHKLFEGKNNVFIPLVSSSTLKMVMGKNRLFFSKYFSNLIQNIWL